MKEFKTVNKIFIKSNNSIAKIFNRYLYCLIPFILLIVIYNLIWASTKEALNLLMTLPISLITCILTNYILNLIKKKKQSFNTLLEENILTIATIISLFSYNTNIIITIVSGVVSIIMKKVLNNTATSSSIYGILLILISSYFINKVETPLSNLQTLSYIDTYSNIVKTHGNILSYTLGLKYYLSPILSLISLVYLFYKKSIKYNIVFSYLFTFTIIMLSFGMLNNMNIWYLFFQLTTGNIIFLSIYCLADYPNTPITGEGQVIYGIILGLLTSILRFIIPELSVVIPLLLGPLLLTKIINNISIKLKYNKKYYYTYLSICGLLILITSILLNIFI